MQQDRVIRLRTDDDRVVRNTEDVASYSQPRTATQEKIIRLFRSSVLHLDTLLFMVVQLSYRIFDRRILTVELSDPPARKSKGTTVNCSAMNRYRLSMNKTVAPVILRFHMRRTSSGNVSNQSHIVRAVDEKYPREVCTSRAVENRKNALNDTSAI